MKASFFKTKFYSLEKVCLSRQLKVLWTRVNLCILFIASMFIIRVFDIRDLYQYAFITHALFALEITITQNTVLSILHLFMFEKTLYKCIHSTPKYAI